MTKWCSLLLAASLAATAAPVPSPFANEKLSYSVNWPSGLSLGEARLESSGSADRFKFELSLDASVPGFPLSDQYRSSAGADLCSQEFVKRATHGKKEVNEKTTFDAQKGMATRETLTKGGGKTEFAASGCARDALAFLYFLRRELSLGRLPGPQTIYFGAPYQLRLEYNGFESVRVNDQRLSADRLTASLKGPASQVTLELFFARDAARTPLVVRVPLALGTFSMELIR